MPATVPGHVLREFGIDGPQHPLDGGQGTSVRVGAHVLKPGCVEEHVAWYAGLVARHADQRVRLAAPRPARDGRWTVDGWSAVPWLTGEPLPDDETRADRWLAVLAAGRALHDSWAHEPLPAHLRARRDRWSAADRAAWAEDEPALGARSAPLVDALLSATRDEQLPRRLVHGDLAGNVLLAPHLAPAVIDVSPYCRPAAYADAVVVVDALLWWQADPALLRLARPADLDPRSWRSLLARAAVFRLVAFDEPSRTTGVDEELARYERLARRLAADPR
ncbi:MAG: aminoglycoside phosphotransferase [Frankiales bacterium]|nr:aminoglycoside phosphotransferase [Frankiales bacterium]